MTLENGIVLKPPKKWTWGWPEIPVLGTLTIRKRPEDILNDSRVLFWENVVFHAFELPSLVDFPFEERMQRLGSFQTDRTTFRTIKMFQIQGDYSQRVV